MPKFLKYLSIGFLVLVIALLVIPFFIPLNSYKNILANKVKEATGRELEIKGDIKLSLLPVPTVIINEAKLTSLKNAQEPFLIEVNKATTALALPALLHGKIKISSIELQEPVINLEVLDNGAKNWEIANNNSTATIDTPILEKNKPIELPFEIDNIKIIKGKLTYTKNKEKKIVEDINIVLNIKDTKGPIDFAIDLTAFATKIDIQGNVKELNTIIPITLDLKALEQKITIDGSIDIANSSFEGTAIAKGNTKNFNIKDFQTDYELNAPLTIDNNQLIVREARLKAQDMEVAATADYNISQNNGQAKLILNPGNINIDIASSNDRSAIPSLNIKLEAQTLKPLFDALKISKNLPPIINQKLIFTANLFCFNKEIGARNINFTAGNSNVQGMIKAQDWQNNLTIPYDLKINNLESLLTLLGINNSTAIGAVQISGSTQKIKEVFHTDNKIGVFGSIITLKGDINLSAKKPNISLDLKTDSFNLDRLNSQPKGGGTVVRGKAPWSNSPIDLSFLDSIEASITAQIGKVLSGSLVLNSIKTNLNIKEGKLNITSLTSDVYGGHLSLSGYVNGSKDKDMMMKISLKDAYLKNIAPSGGKIKVTEGKLNLQADLKSKGNSVYKYIENLTGIVNLNALNGKISGFDLNKIVDAVKNLKNIQGLLGVMDSSFSNGETSFKSLNSNINIINGIATLKECHLDATPAIADATGQVNLPQYTLDITAAVVIDSLPPFGAKIYGMLDQPQHTLDTKALQNYLTKNVLNSVIKDIKNGETKPENIIKDVLGLRKNKSNNETTNQGAEENSTPKQNDSPVNQLLQQGFKKLLK